MPSFSSANSSHCRITRTPWPYSPKLQGTTLWTLSRPARTSSWRHRTAERSTVQSVRSELQVAPKEYYLLFPRSTWGCQGWREICWWVEEMNSIYHLGSLGVWPDRTLLRIYWVWRASSDETPTIEKTKPETLTWCIMVILLGSRGIFQFQLPPEISWNFCTQWLQTFMATRQRDNPKEETKVEHDRSIQFYARFKRKEFEIPRFTWLHWSMHC